MKKCVKDGIYLGRVLAVRRGEATLQQSELEEGPEVGDRRAQEVPNQP